MFFKITRASDSHIDTENYPPCDGAIWSKPLNDWIINFDSIESLVSWCDKHGEDIIINFKRQDDVCHSIMIYDDWIE
jgi:phenolic acid decarboxylase